MDYESCSCDSPPAEFSSIATVKARKTFKCYECHGLINPGDSHEKTAGKWEGNFESFRTCSRCAELKKWARISVPCFCYTYGEVLYDVKNLVDEARHDCPPGFTMEWGRRMIKIERHATGQHWPRQWKRNRPPRSAIEIVNHVP